MYLFHLRSGLTRGELDKNNLIFFSKYLILETYTIRYQSDTFLKGRKHVWQYYKAVYLYYPLD